jgi:outer membrane protein OmpA-like peptidoglycan-associated protein
MIAAIAFFLLGAGAGVFLATRHFLRQRLPEWVAVAHGLAGATGFALLLFFCAHEPSFIPARIAIGILIPAVALGCVNVVFHLRGKRHHTAVIIAHALCAVAGVGTLTYGAFVYGQRPSPAAPPPGAPPADTSAVDRVVAAADVRGSVLAMADAREGGSAAIAEPLAPRTGGTGPQATAPIRSPGWAWQQRSVQFEIGRATPSDASAPEIAAIAEDLEREPDVKLVLVQGHADERGGDGANLPLTRARARAVVDALVAKGIAPSRLRAAGYAARCPLSPSCRGPSAPPSCHEESEWQRDRRVTFLVLETSRERYRGTVACDGARDLLPAEDVAYESAVSGSAAR